MKLALLALAALCLLTAAADPEESAASEEEVGDGEDSCPAETKTVTKTLGGKVISQVLVQMETKLGCKWVMQGGTPESFVSAEGCGKCRVRDGHVMCTGPGVAGHPVCAMARGPDCRLHAVNKTDSALPCKLPVF